MKKVLINLFTSNQILALSKTKHLQTIVTVAQMDNISDKEKTMGKGENYCNWHFLLTPQCIQKPSFPGLLKVGAVQQRYERFHVSTTHRKRVFENIA